MKKLFIIHPFLFAIFPILFLLSHNIERLSLFSDTLLPSAIVLSFTLLLVLMSGLILRDNKKAGIIVSIFSALFFSYGHVFDMMQSWQIGNFLVGRHRYLMLIWGMLFTCSGYFVVRTRRDLVNFTKIFNIVAFSLVVIPLINIGVYEFKTRGAWQDNSGSTEDRETNITDLGNAAIHRDIYYIILDGYASSSTLKEIYDYDNHEFMDYLVAIGFYVASKSQSNYAFTNLSLASSLNMEYINYLSDIVGVESKDTRVPYQLINDNRVMRFLKSKGYKYIHFRSGVRWTNHNQYADWNVQCGVGGEFLTVLIQTTMLRPLEYYLIEEDARERVLCTFSKLAEVHRMEGPKFVFAHIICPHPPYVFGANGEPIPQTELKMSGGVWKQKENYLDQLIFVNKKVEMLVDEILSKSEVPPIIILQADHGPASTFPDSGWPDRPTEKMLRESMRIFNAYYLPSNGNDLLYDSITPVNTFRLVFNFYFDANYELLNDQSYYSEWKKHPYKFTDVTDKVRYD